MIEDASIKIDEVLALHEQFMSGEISQGRMAELLGIGRRNFIALLETLGDGRSSASRRVMVRPPLSKLSSRSPRIRPSQFE